MGQLTRAQEPFRFASRLHLRELTGLKARTLSELVQILKEVPGSVIYHHTHHYLQQHQSLSPEPPNDFAYWVTDILQEKALGEKLASINVCDFHTIRSLREGIVSVIENYLKKKKEKLREAREGEEFYFIKSISFVFPTSFCVYDLKEFVDVLKKITIYSIYFHMFEARLRLEKETNDFSLWFEKELQEPDLARKIAALDPYTYTIESLRSKIISLVENRLRG